MPLRVAYVHNVCMPYKLPLLRRLSEMPDIELTGLFGQSHRAHSKFKGITTSDDFNLRRLRTAHVHVPYRGREVNVFWNPGLGRALEQFNPDVVVAGNSNFPNNLQLMRYCRSRRVPWVWHGIGSMYPDASALRRMAEPMLRPFFEGAAGGMAFNSMSKQYYIERYNISSEDIAVVPNVVDTESVALARSTRGREAASLGRELGVETTRVILFVGALYPSKRVDALIAAFARMESTGMSSSLIIVGEGPSRPQLQKQVDDLRLQRVFFVGRQSRDVDLYFMLADIFVLPGLGGLAVSHAMVHGLPVIAGAADGTERDLIAHGVNGYLVQGSEEELSSEIAGYVSHLLSDDGCRRHMGEASASRIHARFAIGHCARRAHQALVALAP